jgi:hypothetical protein
MGVNVESMILVLATDNELKLFFLVLLEEKLLDGV